jgi:hypothetical protein
VTLNPGYRLVIPTSWNQNQLAISEEFMKKISVVLLALAAALAFSPSLLADPYIFGTIGVTGGNDNWSSTVLNLTGSTGVVADATGSFEGTTSPIVNIPISPASGSGAVWNFTTLTFASPDVLVFTTNMGVATFTITGPISVALNTSEFLDIFGTGTLSLSGYADTPATFSSNSTDSSLNFGNGGSSTFGIDVTSQYSVTPEPGSLTLFGTGLLGLAGMLRRKFKHSR